MAYTSKIATGQTEVLIEEIMLELGKMTPEKLAEAYRVLREMRGRQPRPGTGPLNLPRSHQEAGTEG